MDKLEKCMEDVKVAREALERRLTLVLDCDKRSFQKKYKELTVVHEKGTVIDDK